jgi:uncharacterized metal-binding protein YceD (DUF177 family)
MEIIGMREFSRSLALGLVREAGRDEVLEASEAERAALAARLGIPGIESLRVDMRLVPDADGAILARGRLAARVVQDCVVTLDPVEQSIAEDFALRFLPPGREPADGPEELDEIPSAADGTVDLGEAMAEQLALALDPYPRAPDAALPEAAQEAAASPFAGLAALRDRRH